MNGSSQNIPVESEISFFLDTPNLTGTPERRLLMAILERALLDYVGNDSREVEEAEEWIFSDGDDTKHVNYSSPELSSPSFSFPWLCSELDLDTDQIRAKIRGMPRRGKSRIAPWYLTKGYEHSAKAQRRKSVVIEKRELFGDQIRYRKAS